MAWLTVIPRDGPKYERFDILEAHNERSILSSHTQQICNVRHFGNPRQPRPIGCLADVEQAAAYEYKFQRVGREVRKIRLSDMEEVVFRDGEPTVDKFDNNRSTYINIEGYLRNSAGHRLHRIFGTPGNEYWYGGTQTRTFETLNPVWDRIEADQPDKDRNVYRDLLRVSQSDADARNMLYAHTHDFDDEWASRFITPLEVVREVGETEERFTVKARSHFTCEDCFPKFILKWADDRNVVTRWDKHLAHKVVWQDIVGLKGMTMAVDIEDLKAEIDTDPLTRGYAGMDDQQVADSLNTEDRSVITRLPSTTLLAWAAGGADDGAVPQVESRIERFEKAAQGLPPYDVLTPSLRGIAKAAYVLVQRDNTGLDLNDSSSATMVGALVAGGVLTAAEQAEITALATSTVSRAVELGWTKIYAAHVANARSL